MAYLHKYIVDGKSIYIISDKATKPSGTLSLKQEDWRGRALGRFGTVVEQLKNLSWTKKEDADSEEAPQKGKEIEAFIGKLDVIASDLEKSGERHFALAIDRISDRLDGRKNSSEKE